MLILLYNIQEPEKIYYEVQNELRGFLLHEWRRYSSQRFAMGDPFDQLVHLGIVIQPGTQIFNLCFHFLDLVNELTFIRLGRLRHSVPRSACVFFITIIGVTHIGLHSKRR